MSAHDHRPADQAWFWTEEWQRGEREADEQIAAGNTTVYYSAEEFLASLSAGSTEAAEVMPEQETKP